MSKERNFIKGFLTYFVQILFYPFVLAVSWLMSIWKEIRGAKIKWEK